MLLIWTMNQCLIHSKGTAIFFCFFVFYKKFLLNLLTFAFLKKIKIKNCLLYLTFEQYNVMICCCLYGLQNCNTVPPHSLAYSTFRTHSILSFWPRFWPWHIIPYPTSQEDLVDWNSSRPVFCLRWQVVLVDNRSMSYIYLSLYVVADHLPDRDFMTPKPLSSHYVVSIWTYMGVGYRL